MESRLESFLRDIRVETEGGRILRIRLRAEGLPSEPAGSLAEEALRQIRDYFGGRRQRFELPFPWPQGSRFQAETLRRIAAIPRGEYRCYAQLGPARAVGNVCARNPLPLLIPCHRVLPAAGGIGAYQGGGDMKNFLLQIEGCPIPPYKA